MARRKGEEHPGGAAEGEPAAGTPARRGLLAAAATVLGAMGAFLAVPLGGLFASPLLRGAAGGDWVPIGPADSFGTDRKQVEYTFEAHDGWYTAPRTKRVVVNRQGEAFVCLSTECTHLGCGVTWKGDEQAFHCPCHGGKFDADGNPTVPPPRTPLKRLETRVNRSSGQLEVRET